MADAKYETTTVTLEVDRRQRQRRRVHGIRHRLSPSAASSRHTKRAATRSATPTTRRTRRSCRRSTAGQQLGARRARGQGPRRPARRRATPRRASSRRSRSWASAVRRRSRRIISTIIDRGYVTKRGQALVPELARVQRRAAARGALRRPRRLRLHRRDGGRPRRIAARRADRVDWLNGFYFGSDQHRGLRNIVDNLGEIDAREINSIAIADDITLRFGKYGPYLEVDPTPRRSADGRAAAPGEHPRRPRARRAHRGEGAGAHRRARRRRPRARREPRQRQADRREGRPLRPLRHRARARARSRCRGSVEPDDR